MVPRPIEGMTTMTEAIALIFDTETTGFPNERFPSDHPSQPHVVQLCAILADMDGTVRSSLNLIIDAGVEIPKAASDIHGITAEIAERYGVDPLVACQAFANMAKPASHMIAHNFPFDRNLMQIAYQRTHGAPCPTFDGKRQFCTMRAMTDICRIPHQSGRGGSFKWPKLQEAHKHLFGEEFEGAHDALADAQATLRIFIELQRLGKVEL